MFEDRNNQITIETNDISPDTLEPVDKASMDALNTLIKQCVGFPANKRSRLLRMELKDPVKLCSAYCFAVMGLKAAEIEDMLSSNTSPKTYLHNKQSQITQSRTYGMQQSLENRPVQQPSPATQELSKEIEQLEESIVDLKKQVNYWKQRYGKQTELFNSFIARRVSVEQAKKEKEGLSRYVARPE